MNYIETIEQRIAPLQVCLAQHPLYQTLKSVDDVRTFMKHHVFAVWDFMSLLKALQRELTCTVVPWVPTANPALARFINEIVWGEESDVNELGEPRSHFLMYLEAMEQAGADTYPIDYFLAGVRQGQPVAQALGPVAVPDAVKAFVQFTFEVIERGALHQMAAVFTFGREDLIPDLFLALVREAQANAGSAQYSKLIYYLERHIEVDGDEHGPLALQMVAELCGDNAQWWEEAADAAVAALEQRLALWDSITATIQQQTMDPVV